MKTRTLLFAFLLLPFLSYGQLEARIDSLDFSNNLIVSNDTGDINYIIGKVPLIQIKALVLNKTNKDILLMPGSKYHSVFWIAFKQNNKYYYIPAKYEDSLPVRIAPYGKFSVKFTALAPDMEEKKDAWYWSRHDDLIDSKIIPVWFFPKEKKTDYVTWLKEILPTIRMVMIYGMETGKPTLLVSEPVNPKKIILTGNMFKP